MFRGSLLFRAGRALRWRPLGGVSARVAHSFLHVKNLKVQTVSKPNDDKDANREPAGSAAEKGAGALSGQPVGPRFRDVAVMVPKEYLDRLLSSRTAPVDEEPTEPTTPDELRSILLEVDRLGWQWTTDNPPAIKPKATNLEPQPFEGLQKKHPAFPEELAELIRYVLWGWTPSQQIVGPPSDLPAKASIISDLLLTEDYRSEFFFEHATRLRRFYDLDWEIMVKTAERNINTFPGAAYANLVLETRETQPDLEEQTGSFQFAADATTLKRMIELLQDALKALEQAKTMAHMMRHENGGTDVK